MAKKNSDALAIGIGLGLALLVGAAMSGASTASRETAVELLRDQLGHAGLILVNASVGRTSNGPVWVVTLESPVSGVITLHAQLAETEEPYSPATVADVVGRVVNHVRVIEKNA